MIVAVLALVVFGPQKLPELARSAGRGLSQLRDIAEQVKTDFTDGLDGAVEGESASDTPSAPNVHTETEANDDPKPVAPESDRAVAS